VTIKIGRGLLEQAAGLARRCSSAAVRERVLVSHAVALALRNHLLGSYGLRSKDGRSGSADFAELLDVCDFECGGRRVEVRTITETDRPLLYVPTMPLMVGVLSDVYVCAKVGNDLKAASLHGYARREDLGGAELSGNGLMALLPVDDLRPAEDLAGELSGTNESDPQRSKHFEEWQLRAERIMRVVHDVLSTESALDPRETILLATRLRDDVLRIYGRSLPETGLEALFDRLFIRFGIERPVPAAPGSVLAFRNSATQAEEVSDQSLRDRYYRDQLTVGQRVPLYRHLLENRPLLQAHRRLRQFLDNASEGKHLASPRRRSRIQAMSRIRAGSDWQPPDDDSGPLSAPPVPGAVAPGTPESGPRAVATGPGYDRMPLADTPPPIDFSADPEVVRTVAEGHRLGYWHLLNPFFTTETSMIDHLPHQKLAVYEHMLGQSRLRFLLADDAGAGKTIMTGLYIREMLARRLITRVLILPPAGLVSSWKREMRTLFSLPFRTITGKDARSENPFTGPLSSLLIVSLDTLVGERMFSRLQAFDVEPYDLVIFDEAHKLSADREQDFSIRKTERYKLAEAIAGVTGSGDERWGLDWSAHHLLLLSATPHMGKELPYYYLWRLLEPEVLSTHSAFLAYPKSARSRHYIRRSKEEMVRYDGSPIYPRRVSDTFSYDLTEGEIGEQRLYDETTAYIRHYYNQARILNRSAARLAMAVFQRRMASSTYALLRSFERRLQKLDAYIDAIRSGSASSDTLKLRQRKLDQLRDVLEDKTADEERFDPDGEENEKFEEQALGALVAFSLAELESERVQVRSLLELAEQVHAARVESKFEKLREVLDGHPNEKLIIFTEHRDTLDFLVRSLEALCHTAEVAQIHGRMPYRQRDEAVEFFRKPISEGGARFLVATDAAGEGINLQFCWLMVNYDIPWNPARLEQRMGRIHRYGQSHDPVIIVNLVAGKTREGRVMRTLLDKLDRIGREMGSDKVFDCIGRLFEQVSLKAYMEQAVTEEGAVEAERRIEGTLTKEQVENLREKERRLGEGGNVRSELPRLKASIEQEVYRRVLLGYVRRFVERAAPMLDIRIDGSADSFFTFQPLRPGALDPLLPSFESYSATNLFRTQSGSEANPFGTESGSDRAGPRRMTFYRPKISDAAIWLVPGEPVFERLRAYFLWRYQADALRGAIFVDPAASEPYIVHLALVEIERKADPALPPLATCSVVERRLVGLKQNEAGQIEECPPESLLLLRTHYAPAVTKPEPGFRLAAHAESFREAARSFAVDAVAAPLAEKRRQDMLADLAERVEFVRKGYDFQGAELADRRSRYTEEARAGDAHAHGEITRITNRQRMLAVRQGEALSVLRREPELIAPGNVTFLAHALVLPSTEAAAAR
jgi:SNF2 family DNA or RNA helicase